MVDDLMQNRLDFGDAHSVADQELKVVTAQFQGVEPFSWNVFDGFDRMRVLTYSASVQMIVRMLGNFSFGFFECIFGYEKGLQQQVADVVRSQQLLIDKVRTHALQLEDKRQRVIFERIQSGKAHFYVVKDNVAHAKLYLLETDGGERRRVIVGSANFSERAFGGQQSETLVVFDNDALAWEHYSREYDAIKMTASDRINMPVEPQAAGIGRHTYTEKRRDKTNRENNEGLPSRWALTLPILEILAVEELAHPALVDWLAHQFNVTEAQRDESSPSGKRRFADLEVGHAKRELKWAGLIDYGGGTVRPARITASGRMVLAQKPAYIDQNFLMQFEKYRQKLSKERRR